MKTEYLLQEQVSHVLAALTPQNRLIARVCLHTGLRVGDVVGIPAASLASQFMVSERKTGKKKRVGLPAELLAEIRAQSDRTWAFPGREEGKHKTRQAVWADVKRAAKAFRLPQNIAPHSFRKVYAVDLLGKYGDLERVRRAMNHSGVEVTLIYAMADRLLEARQNAANAVPGRHRKRI